MGQLHSTNHVKTIWPSSENLCWLFQEETQKVPLSNKSMDWANLRGREGFSRFLKDLRCNSNKFIFPYNTWTPVSLCLIFAHRCIKCLNFWQNNQNTCCLATLFFICISVFWPWYSFPYFFSLNNTYMDISLVPLWLLIL